MDIDILLALQQLREGPGGCLAEFFSKMTWFGEMNVVLVIMALIYWCADKDTGTYLLMGWNGNRIVNGVLKVVFISKRTFDERGVTVWRYGCKERNKNRFPGTALDYAGTGSFQPDLFWGTHTAGHSGGVSCGSAGHVPDREADGVARIPSR